RWLLTRRGRGDDRPDADAANPGNQSARPLRRSSAGRGHRLPHKCPKGTGYHYAPDPSSQGACTIGGNVATNSGGPHTLKYGVTVNHTLGIEAVMPNGEILTT